MVYCFYIIIGSCVLKASVDRVSVDTIGRYGDQHSADMSAETQLCVGQHEPTSMSADTRPILHCHSAATRLPLGRHSADTLPTLDQHLTHLVNSCYRRSSIFPALLSEAFSGRRPFLAFNFGNIHVFFQLCFFLVIAFIYDPRYCRMQQHLGIVAFGGLLF